MHSPCYHNHINALYGRVGSCVPYPTKQALSDMYVLAGRLARRIGKPSKLSRPQVLEYYSGKKLKRYTKAHEKLLKCGEYVDSRVKMFVKQELIEFKQAKVNPDCRAIQFRDPTYAIQLAQYIRPIEQRLNKIKAVKGFPTLPFIAKGMNQRARARRIEKMYQNIPNGFTLCLDAERCDAHITAELLKVEHSVYTGVFRDKYLSKLLAKQLVTKGEVQSISSDRSRSNIKYTCKGGRCSGDFNTSSGNGIIISIAIALFCFKYKFQLFDFLVDGDDSVIRCLGVCPPANEIIDFFRTFGLTMKIESQPQTIHDVEFCQHRLVYDAIGPIMVRNPQKILTKTTINPKFGNISGRPSLLKTIATGELSTVRGIPVVAEYLSYLIRVADNNQVGKNPVKLLSSNFWLSYRLKRDLPEDWSTVKKVPISPQARETFAKAWGISIPMQKTLEASFRSLRMPNILEHGILGCGIDRQNWFFDLHMREAIF